MNRILAFSAVLFVGLGINSGSSFASQINEAKKVRVENSLAKLPLRFEKNEGQTLDEVKFISRGSGYTMYFTPTESVMVLRQPVKTPSLEEQRHNQINAIDSISRETSVVRMKVVGANKETIIKGKVKLPGISNYFKGSDPSKWQQGVANFMKVQYQEVYPGIDLVYYGNQRKLEYDFVVKPGADPEKIQLHFEGTEKLSLDNHGNLVLETKIGKIIQYAPVIYQSISGEKQSIKGRYVIKNNHDVAFQLAKYDPNHNLVIDPVLAYSSFLGGTGTDTGNGIAVDSTGNTYVIGSTGSTDFPVTAGTFDPSHSGSGDDVFVTKLNATGSALVYSTYLGGNGTDRGNGIAVDNAGNAYVTGDTLSTDFPTTVGAFDTTHNDKDDVFVTQLNTTGSGLVYSTYLGGSGVDRSNSIEVDNAGNAWVTGQIFSTDFPITAGAFDTTHNGAFDAFVSKLNTGGSSLAYSTFLGGALNDQARDIAVDGSGNAHVTGSTLSSNFPTTAGAIDTTYNGAFDAFVSKLNATGSSLAYSTFLGDNLSDQGNGIALDGSGNAHVTGSTGSAGFPTTGGALDTTHNGSTDAFVSKLNTAGNSLVYSTFLGGTSIDQGNGIAVDSLDNTWVTGETRSADFAISVGAFDSTHNGLGDVFVSKLDASGSNLEFSTFFGGGIWDKGHDIAVDNADKAYVTGNAGDANFPTTTGAFDTSHNGSSGRSDAFVLKLEEDVVPPVIILNGINPTHAELGHPYADPGATAIDYVDGPLPISTTSQAGVPGTFEVVYSATDNSGNTTTATRVVIPADSTPPVITILGANPLNSEIGLPFVDPGTTAIDLVDGPLPVATATQVGTTPGTLEVIYFATDNSGNTATATRILNPVDTTPPVITILGANPINAQTGQPYVDPWATATDFVDGPVAVTAITQPGATSGTLEVIYSATDNSGNTSTAVRVVNILP